MKSKDRYFVPPNQPIEEIPTDVEHLYFCGFGDYAKNELILSNNSFPQLESLTIGHSCFQHVREFVLDGLECLESVKIGEYCFRISHDERNDGICRITNCPNLRQLEIGDWNFSDFKSFELSNLNSLQSIEFGEWCFQYTDFSLKGEWKEWNEWMKYDLNENGNDVLDLPSLEIVSFGRCSFQYCHLAVFESMWWLFIFISFHFSF